MLIRRGSSFNAITENAANFGACGNFSMYSPCPVKFGHYPHRPHPAVFKTPRYYLNSREIPVFGITASESNPENQIGTAICRFDGRLASAYSMPFTSSVPNLKSGFRRILGDRPAFTADGGGASSGLLPEGLAGEDGRGEIPPADIN